MVLVKFDSLETAKAYVAQDPYTVGKVWDKVVDSSDYSTWLKLTRLVLMGRSKLRRSGWQRPESSSR